MGAHVNSVAPGSCGSCVCVTGHLTSVTPQSYGDPSVSVRSSLIRYDRLDELVLGVTVLHRKSYEWSDTFTLPQLVAVVNWLPSPSLTSSKEIVYALKSPTIGEESSLLWNLSLQNILTRVNWECYWDTLCTILLVIKCLHPWVSSLSNTLYGVQSDVPFPVRS